MCASLGGDRRVRKLERGQLRLTSVVSCGGRACSPPQEDPVRVWAGSLGGGGWRVED